MPLISEIGRRNFRVRTLLLTITGFLWLGVVLHLFPVWFAGVTSIKSTWELSKMPPTLWPQKPTLLPYTIIINIEKLQQAGGIIPGTFLPGWVYLKNSFIFVGAIMAIQIPITAFAAYALSKLQGPKWNRVIFLFFIGPMLVPYQVSLLPTYLLLKTFPFAFRSIPHIPFSQIPFPHRNFLNTYWAVILPACFSGFNFLLLKGSFDTIPNSIVNAARIDGASEIKIFTRLILPISKPAFAVVAYFTFSGVWNQFMWPLIVLSKEEIKPFAVYIYQLQTVLGSAGRMPEVEEALPLMLGWNAVMALAIIQSIPVFITFIIFREQLMKGIKLRGFK